MSTQIKPTNFDLYQHLCRLCHNSGPSITISIVGGGGKTHLAFWLAKLFKAHGQRVCLTTTTKMYLPNEACLDHCLALEEDKTLYNSSQLARRLCQEKPANHAPAITFLYKNTLPLGALDEPVKVQGLSDEQLNAYRGSGLFTVFIVEADGAKQLPIKAPSRHEPCIATNSDLVIGVTGAEVILKNAQPEQIHRWSEFEAITHCKPQTPIDQPVLQRLITSPDGMFKGSPPQANKMWVINKYDLSPNQTALSQLAKRICHQTPELSTVWLTSFHSPSPIQGVFS